MDWIRSLTVLSKSTIRRLFNLDCPYSSSSLAMILVWFLLQGIMLANCDCDLPVELSRSLLTRLVKPPPDPRSYCWFQTGPASAYGVSRLFGVNYLFNESSTTLLLPALESRSKFPLFTPWANEFTWAWSSFPMECRLLGLRSSILSFGLFDRSDPVDKGYWILLGLPLFLLFFLPFGLPLLF